MSGDERLSIRELFGHAAIVDKPRRIFLLWHAWQRTPVKLLTKQRARLAVEELQQGDWPGEMVESLVPHVVTVAKKLPRTTLRLFGMRGVRCVHLARAECSCGAQLSVSEYRPRAEAPLAFYADR